MEEQKRQTKAPVLRNDVEKADKRTGRRVRAIVIKAKQETVDGVSNAIQDPWASLTDVRGLVEPPFDLLGLTMLKEMSSELGQTIEAMETNIVGYGWRLRLAVKEKKDTPEATAEYDRFHEFLTYANYEPMSSFVRLRSHTRQDLELTGNAFWEIIRNDKGEIDAFNHIPAYTMRLGRLQKEAVEVEQTRVVGRGEDRRLETKRLRRRFRNYAQGRVSYGTGQSDLVWFKQYGDPRPVSKKTGHPRREGEEEIPKEELATEVIHFKIYSGRSPYGVPRYIGNTLAIFGSNAAENVTYTTLKSNNVPSMALMVSEGELTDATVERIEEFVEENVQGAENYGKMLIIEAEPFGEGDEMSEAPNPVKMELKPLTSAQHTDALFQQYDSKNQDKIRRAYRLPPILVGRAEDYNRVTAETSKKLADEQIFAPERAEEDFIINTILHDMGMVLHVFVTNSPNVTNDEDLIAVMTGAEKSGGMTPRISRAMLEDIMGAELGDVEGIDPDLPFSLQMAEAVKNLAQPNEPGQQVTALKLLSLMQDEEPLSFETVLKAADGSELPGFGEVIVNVGAQARSIIGGEQRALLSAVMMNLTGRNMLLGDGKAIHGRAVFGERERMTVDRAAKLIGQPLEVVQAMFPKRAEVWAHHIDKASTFEPSVLYQQPENIFFSRYNVNRNTGGRTPNA